MARPCRRFDSTVFRIGIESARREGGDLPERSGLIVPGTLAETRGVTRVQPPARWPQRIIDLAIEWRSAAERADRDRPLGELWLLVNVALQRYARAAALRFGLLDPEDIRDIAADKALELLGRLGTRVWDPAASTPAEISAFLASVARHGVVDRLRARRREIRLSWDRPVPGLSSARGSVAFAPSTDSESAEHARAIIECARCLTARARQAWFLRVFYDLSSVDIAGHPEVASKPSAVDAMLLRSRRFMRGCMLGKGFDPGALPVGTFTMLWEFIAKNRVQAASPSIRERR